MIKKLLMVLMFLVLASPAFAVTKFDYYKMVSPEDVGNATASQNNPAVVSYALNQTPYLYFHVTPAPTTTPSVLATWYDKTNEGYLVTSSISSSSVQGWLAISSWGTLTDNQKLGDWRINTFLKDGRNLLDCREVSFVVTPEPMGIILYGLGGLPLVAWLRRKRV